MILIIYLYATNRNALNGGNLMYIQSGILGMTQGFQLPRDLSRKLKHRKSGRGKNQCMVFLAIDFFGAVPAFYPEAR